MFSSSKPFGYTPSSSTFRRNCARPSGGAWISLQPEPSRPLGAGSPPHEQHPTTPHHPTDGKHNPPADPRNSSTDAATFFTSAGEGHPHHLKLLINSSSSNKIADNHWHEHQHCQYQYQCHTHTTHTYPITLFHFHFFIFYVCIFSCFSFWVIFFHLSTCFSCFFVFSSIFDVFSIFHLSFLHFPLSSKISIPIFCIFSFLCSFRFAFHLCSHFPTERMFFFFSSVRLRIQNMGLLGADALLHCVMGHLDGWDISTTVKQFSAQCDTQASSASLTFSLNPKLSPVSLGRTTPFMVKSELLSDLLGIQRSRGMASDTQQVCARHSESTVRVDAEDHDACETLMRPR